MDFMVNAFPGKTVVFP